MLIRHISAQRPLDRKLVLLLAGFAMAAMLSTSVRAEARGCQKNDVLYHFGFKDWKSQGTGWKARDADFSGKKKGPIRFCEPNR